jgi:hypothetical protein
VKKYYKHLALVLLSTTFISTVHAHTGHYHIMGALHSHALSEVLFATMLAVVGVYLLIKR